MSCTIPEIVDIRFDLNTFHSIYGLFIILVECELDVCFAELDLLIAQSSTGMKERRPELRLELALICRKLDLMDQFLIRITEKPILCHLVPDYPPQILERISNRQIDLPHRGGQVE